MNSSLVLNFCTTELSDRPRIVVTFGRANNLQRYSGRLKCIIRGATNLFVYPGSQYICTATAVKLYKIVRTTFEFLPKRRPIAFGKTRLPVPLPRRSRLENSLEPLLVVRVRIV